MKETNNTLLRGSKWMTFLVVFAAFVVGCETYEPALYEGPEFINFEKAELKIREDDGVSKIRVNLGGKLSISQLTVKYTVEANDNAVALYKIKNEGTLVIPGGSGYAEIELTPTNNDIPDGEKFVTLNIFSIEGGDNYIIGFPGPDALNSSVSIKILDDDCPLDRDFIVGSLTETAVEIVEEGETPDGPYYTDVVISADPNPKVVTVNDFFGLTGYLKVYLDPCEGEATIYDHDITYFDQTEGPLKVTPTGTGIFDEEAKILVMELTLDVTGGSFGKWKFTYKK